MKVTQMRTLSLAMCCSMILSACGGSDNSSSSTPPTPPATGQVVMSMSDASANAEDFANIGVKVESIALIPQSGGANVTVYTAASASPSLNLVQIDEISDVLASASVAPGTYTGVVVTLSGNASDVLLVASSNPSATFAGTAGAALSAGQIQVANTTGAAGSLSVPVTVSFAAPVTVAANANTPIDIEFNSGDPCFLVADVSATAGLGYSVNFNSTLTARELRSATRRVLRDSYGQVTAVASDSSSVTFAKEVPTLPIVSVSSETAVSTGTNLTLLADSTNGTEVYDVDAGTAVSVKDFSTVSLNGKQVRVALRYQADGSLVVTRMWTSASFATLYAAAEGHVLHADATANTLTVTNEDGTATTYNIDANTQFFVRTPQTPASDATAVATGTSFVANGNIKRGFKVHVTADSTSANPLVAQSVEIEVAKYAGIISAASSTGFTDTRAFVDTTDDYTLTLPYIAASSANSVDANGNAVAGFKWSYFSDSATLDTGANAATDFATATSAAASLGGSLGTIAVTGRAHGVFADAANPTGFSINSATLISSRLPIGTVANGLANNAFTATFAGAATATTVDLSTTAGVATRFYTLNRAAGVLALTSADLTTTAGQSGASAALTAGSVIKVFGVPQLDGSIKANVVVVFTGDPTIS